ncbi:hypothetical protein GUITHDRAFT_138098 [Guillardia theta CCMP2712]|uniref:Cyclic nucleotide-binding domain-containing protein n=1 Tax=Guillardia theta (strain CCMP2712) TaxID=905079 RepID=L1JEM4_GUITC|nr:hypothetical protein GUITHDRAFT_138098 [Guillardia theta CCMP2712]EKX46752.1 hypothetical protein GUITHDRAFT_138098 [Guillardia theta CCMP2712]|eukprot:XP_005833732.1 hypothetical protein GUITHDRAFT_138098 [Guillardia theta CCMP2712]
MRRSASDALLLQQSKYVSEYGEGGETKTPNADYGDLSSYKLAQHLVQKEIWNRKYLQKFEKFENLSQSALSRIEGHFQYLATPANSWIIRQDQRCNRLYFVVLGVLDVYRDDEKIGSISKGCHFGTESLNFVVRNYSRGLEYPSNIQATISVKAVQPSTCLFLDCQDLWNDVSILREIITADMEASEDLDPSSGTSDDEEKINIQNDYEHQLKDFEVFAGVGREHKARSIQDLVSQRDELLRKLEAAKLLAKKQELEAQVKKLQGRLAQPSDNAGGAEMQQQQQQSLLKRSNSDEILRLRDRSELEGNLSRISSAALESNLMQERAKLEAQLNMLLRSSSSASSRPNSSNFSRAPSGNKSISPKRNPSEGELWRLEEGELSPLEYQETFNESPKHGGQEQKDVGSINFNVQSKLHPILNGVIPFPSKSLYEPPPHMKKWGYVWETSHYFEHAAYKRNQPRRGVPVDTSGDGRVDSLAVDFTGDGKIDTIVTDEHSGKVALVKQFSSQSPSSSPPGALKPQRNRSPNRNRGR